MGWSGFGAVTFLVTKRRFCPPQERRGSRNLLIPLCPGRDSNPHEGNPHRILSPAGGISNYLPNNEKSRRSELAILAGVGWSELE